MYLLLDAFVNSAD